MHVIVQQKELAALLKDLMPAVGRKSGGYPILDHVLATARDGQLELLASNLDLTITGSVPVEMKRDGTVTIPFAMLRSLVGNMTGPIELDGKGVVTKLRYAKTKYDLRGLDPVQFPRLPEVAGEVLDLPVNELKRAISVSTWCAIDSASLPFGAIRIMAEGGRLSVTATQGQRLGKYETPTGNVDFLKLVQKGFMDDMMPLLEGRKGEMMTLKIAASHIVFGLADRTMTTRLMDVGYPEAEKIIPVTFDHVVRLPRQTMLASLERLLLVSKDSTSIMKFTPGALAMRLVATASVEGEEVVDVEWLDTPTNMEVGIDPAMLRQGIKCMEGDKVDFSFNTPLTPTVLTAEGLAGAVVMIAPCRFQ